MVTCGSDPANRYDLLGVSSLIGVLLADLLSSFLQRTIPALRMSKSGRELPHSEATVSRWRVPITAVKAYLQFVVRLAAVSKCGIEPAFPTCWLDRQSRSLVRRFPRRNFAQVDFRPDRPTRQWAQIGYRGGRRVRSAEPALYPLPTDGHDLLAFTLGLSIVTAWHYWGFFGERGA